MKSNPQQNRAIKSGYSFVSSSLLVSLIGVIVVPIYMLFLTPAEYGIFSLFLSSVILLVPLLSLSGDAILARLYFYNSPEKHSRSVLLGSLMSTTIINSIFVGSLILISFEKFLSLFDNGNLFLEYKFLIVLSAISIVFIKMYERALKSAQDIYVNPIIKISRSLIQIIISLSCIIFLDLNYFSLIIGFAMAATIIGSASLVGYIKKYKVVFDANAFLLIYRYTLPLIPNRFAAYAVNPIINFLILGILNLSLVGIYNIAYLVMNVMLMVFQKVNEAFQPWLYENFFTTNPDFLNINNSIKLLYTSLIITTCLAMLIAPMFLEYIFPSYFNGQADFIRILLIFPLVNSSKALAVSLLMKNEKGGYFISLGTYSYIILLFILGIFLIPQYELVGVALSMIISRYLSSELTIYFAIRDKDINRVTDFKRVRTYILIFISICISKIIIDDHFDILNTSIIVNVIICILSICLCVINKNSLIEVFNKLTLRNK